MENLALSQECFILTPKTECESPTSGGFLTSRLQTTDFPEGFIFLSGFEHSVLTCDLVASSVEPRKLLFYLDWLH